MAGRFILNTWHRDSPLWGSHSPRDLWGYWLTRHSGCHLPRPRRPSLLPSPRLAFLTLSTLLSLTLLAIIHEFLFSKGQFLKRTKLRLSFALQEIVYLIIFNLDCFGGTQPYIFATVTSNLHHARRRCGWISRTPACAVV